MNLSVIQSSSHGEILGSALASNLRQSSFADVKIICYDGSAWAHRLILAAVSPVLKQILLSVHDQEDVVTLFLPQLSKFHLSLVLDYVYRGRMFIKASQLQHVLGVIEVLNLECGVSVSKKVEKDEDHETSWVEEAVFKSFHDKGIGEVCFKSLIEEKEFGYEQELGLEKAIEVKPDWQKSRSLRNSAVIDDEDDEDYAVVEVGNDDSDSEDENSNDSSSEQSLKCIMCSKVFRHAENLRVHVQSHLGSKTQLRSCTRCKKNFRTHLEHELHMSSHAYVSHLKYKIENYHHSSNKPSLAVKKSRSLIRKSVQKLQPKRADLPPQSAAPAKVQPPPTEIIPQPTSSNSKKATKKSSHKSEEIKKFPSLKIQLSPRKNSHWDKNSAWDRNEQEAKQTKKAKRQRNKGHQSKLVTKQNGLKPLKIKASGWPQLNSCKLKLKIPLVRIDEGQNFPKSPSKKASKGQKRKLSESHTPGSPSKKAKSSSQGQSQGQSTPKPTLEDKLTCPTCDKIFVAKSILERHLKKSKHGIFEKDKDVMAPPPIVSQALDKAFAEGRQLPHLNQVLQPKIQVGGREVNKYECHLCKQVFLRVKDLAKHRERMMCSAWH